MNEARTAYYGALTAFSLVGTAIAEALGGWDGALKTLVCIMAVDYITGVVCALIWHKSQKSADGTFESKASIKGLFRKGADFARRAGRLQGGLARGHGGRYAHGGNSLFLRK